MENKIYRMNDEEAVIAKSAKEARKFYEKETCLCPDEIGPIRQIKALEKHEIWWVVRDLNHLEGMVYRFGELKVGHFSGMLAVMLTYQQALEMYDGDIPEIFCSTEW